MNAMFAKAALAASLAIGALTLGASSAAATPLMDKGVAEVAGAAAQIDAVRWVCNPYRCWWRPNYYRPYGYYGPRRHWGYHRHWGWRRRYW